MKNLTIALLMVCALFTTVSADIGIKVGVSAQIGSMEASGKEANSDGATATRVSNTREALFGTGGYFIEKDLAFLPGRLGDLGSRISIGYDNIVHDLDVGTVNNVREKATLTSEFWDPILEETDFKEFVKSYYSIGHKPLLEVDLDIVEEA